MRASPSRRITPRLYRRPTPEAVIRVTTLVGVDGNPWALYDLRIWTERLELRLPTEEELYQLVEIARSGIHDPNDMPFGFAWTDQPSPQFERSFMQYHWSTRANWSPGKW